MNGSINRGDVASLYVLDAFPADKLHLCDSQKRRLKYLFRVDDSLPTALMWMRDGYGTKIYGPF